jgi:RNA polymerase sigma-70 factor (ECF subfamily)
MTPATRRHAALTAPHTVGLIRSVLKDPAQSEEVAQEVYLEIWQNAARFDADKSSATSVLFTLARRRAIDRIRASQASRNRDVLIGIRDTADPYDQVAESIETSLEYERARRAMKKLTHIQREVIELVHDEHLTQKEAALRLGLPLGTVKTRLRDSLIALRRELTPRPNPADGISRMSEAVDTEPVTLRPFNVVAHAGKRASAG